MKKIATVTADNTNKRIAIGKNGVNIERAKLIAKKTTQYKQYYFKIAINLAIYFYFFLITSFNIKNLGSKIDTFINVKKINHHKISTINGT